MINIVKDKSLIERQKAQMTQIIRNNSLHLLMIVFYDRVEAKIEKLLLDIESNQTPRKALSVRWSVRP